MGRKEQRRVKGWEEEVFCDAKRKSHKKKKQRAPGMWQECCVKQSHVWVSLGPALDGSPRDDQASSWAGRVGTHISGP